MNTSSDKNQPLAQSKHDCEQCTTRPHGILCSLESDALRDINQAKFHHTYKPGQTIFYAGNPATGIYCVTRGTIKLEANDMDGKSQIVQVYGAGSMIGYRALFSHEPYQSSGIAVEECEICFIPKATILKTIQENPDLAMKFMVQLSQDFKMMENRLQRVLARTAAERIAEALLFLRENFQEKHWTRKEIAEWAGTTTETVIRSLADLEDEGIIEQKGRAIKIVDREELLSKARISH